MSPQGKKRAPAPPADRGAARKRLALLVLGVFVLGSLVVVGVAQGLGPPSVPEGDVALVEDVSDGAITTDEFDAALEQTAARQGVGEVPPPENPQYALLRDAAMSDLILSRWVLGEAEERGIEATDREIDEELERVKEQQFGSEEEFQRFLEQSGFSVEEARERIALQVVSDRIQQQVLGGQPEVTDDEVRAYYDGNPEQFTQPEARDVRVVLTKTEAEADEVFAELEADSSPAGFERVARQYSTDEATRNSGGLREGLVEGQSDPALDEQAFAAAEGELVGPFETEAGFYVIRVERVTPGSTTAFGEAGDQIRQTLVSARQQELGAAFQEDFQAKWTARTFCADEYAIDRCANAPSPPSACTEELAETTGCDAPVPSTRPIQPGTATVFGAPAAQGLPQGPITQPGAAGVPAGLPPGLSPVPGGAPPTVPPGG